MVTPFFPQLPSPALFNRKASQAVLQTRAARGSRPARPVLSVFSLALLACASTAPAWASHVGETLASDQQIVSGNDTLVRTLQQWETTPAAERSRRVGQLDALAAQRRDRLLALLERNPVLAASRFLPAALRERLPASTQGLMEREVQASGSVVAVVADDFARGVSKKDYFLQLNDNAAQRLQLHLADGLGGERDMLGWVGRKVKLNGTQLGNALVVTDKRAVLVAADGSGSTVTSVGTTAIVKGDQKTLTILANFSDAAVTCTAADLQNRLFGGTGSTVNTHFRNSSRSQVSFSGQVIGPISIPYSVSGTCNYSGWATAAEAAAKAMGVDPALFSRVNFVTPNNANCGWTGLAYMPGRQSWVQACSTTGVFTHELGHNLALHHAGTPTAEYGDSSDPMGGARSVQFNAANRVMAGWMAPGSVVDISAAGSFSLDALELTTATSPQVMRIFKADTNEWYHLSLRQALDLDTALSTTHLNAISIHKTTGTLPARTTLVASLQVGQSWTDATNAISVTNQGLNGSTAQVGVSMTGAPVCTRGVHSVALTPATQTGAPGAARSYAVAIKNNDSTACAAATYSLAQTLPTGFGGSLPGSLSVAPGATVNTSWTVTPSGGVVAGSYGLDVRVADSAGAGPTSHATYTVVTAVADTTPPALAVAYPLAGSSVSGNRVSIAATASDASGVARVEFYVDGRLLATDTLAPYSATWNLRKLPKGAHLVQVRAYDSAGNMAQADSNVIVN